MKAEPVSISLREQHAELTRELILRAVAELLADDRAGEFTMPDVALRAGVSLRTVYRYFPTREDLDCAAADWVDENVFGGIPSGETAEDLPQAFRSACERWEQHPRLARAMAVSRAGRRDNFPRRQHRLAAIHRALAEVTNGLPESERRKAVGVLEYLESALAWATMRETSARDGGEVGEAVEWAMRTLIEDLRRRNAAGGRAGTEARRASRS